MLSNLISQLKQAKAEDKYYEVLAEIPRVREDFGYPPLVTPTSQIVGSQAVLNVLSGERYKVFTKESKGLLRGEYGKVPAPVNEVVRKKAIGDEEVITCRPADLLPPELEKYKLEAGLLAHNEEDVLSYALFPQVAKSFFEKRESPAPFLHSAQTPPTHEPQIRSHKNQVSFIEIDSYSTDFNDSTISIFLNLKYISQLTKIENPKVITTA